MTALCRLLPLALLTACATNGTRDLDPTVHAALRGVESRFGVESIADAAERADVLFLGEMHGNADGHRLQLATLDALRRRGVDIVVSMEMFERDVQGALDAYLSGRIDEATFKATSRPWPRYQSDYRPVVEYARAHRIPVVAANAPRDAARKVSQQGVAELGNDPNVARSTSAPRDAYWTAFVDAMKGHMGTAGEDAMYRMYQAQCMKDDTMAESILAARDGAPRRENRPLVVVHWNGKFHSDHRLGTVARVLERRADLKVVVVTMRTATADGERGLVRDADGGDFCWVVAEPPKAAPRPAPKPATVPTPAPTTTPEAQTPEAPQDGRPAFGLMPSYDSDAKGLLVDSVVEGGAAEAAGIEAGDLLKKIDGKEIDDVRGYMDVLSSLRIGQTVTVEAVRDGQPKTFTVKVGIRRS
jgi:uncharacterized iron-regulated protein